MADDPRDEQAQADLRLSRLNRRLVSILTGAERHIDPSERLELAEHAFLKRLPATSARLYSEALASDSNLDEAHRTAFRYRAASAAVLTGSRGSYDVPRPDEAARAKLRTQALGWLRAELAIWENVVNQKTPETSKFVAARLDFWKDDPNLAGIRDADALARLPEAERKAWQALWGEVDSLLARVTAK